MSDTERPTFHASTSRNLAFMLLGAFTLGIIFAGYGAYQFQDNADGAWLDIFKSGFLILGGSLSSVIGYYFGSRESQAAEQSVKASQATIKQMQDELAAAANSENTLRRAIRILETNEDRDFAEGPTDESADLEIPTLELGPDRAQ